MYKKEAGNDKRRKDTGNRTLCPYRNFSQAIMFRLAYLVDPTVQRRECKVRWESLLRLCLIKTIIYVAWFSSQTSLLVFQNLHHLKPQQHCTNDRITQLFYNLQLEYNFLQQSKFSWENYYQRSPSQVCPSQVSVNSNVSRMAAFSSWLGIYQLHIFLKVS